MRPPLMSNVRPLETHASKSCRAECNSPLGLPALAMRQLRGTGNAWPAYQPHLSQSACAVIDHCGAVRRRHSFWQPFECISWQGPPGARLKGQSHDGASRQRAAPRSQAHKQPPSTSAAGSRATSTRCKVVPRVLINPTTHAVPLAATAEA